MSGPLDFTARQAALLHRLVYAKDFQPGTREHIARWLIAKRSADSPSRQFVSRLIEMSFLKPAGLRRVKAGPNYLDRPIYDRDIQRIKEVWQATPYGKFTFAIIDEDRVVI